MSINLFFSTWLAKSPEKKRKGFWKLFWFVNKNTGTIAQRISLFIFPAIPSYSRTVWQFRCGFCISSCFVHLQFYVLSFQSFFIIVWEGKGRELLNWNLLLSADFLTPIFVISVIFSQVESVFVCFVILIFQLYVCLV